MFGNDWDNILEEEINQPYFVNILKILNQKYQTETIFPEKKNVFRAFKMTPYHKVKVVILGQDPYHGDKEAIGLSFAVPKEVSMPPSLKNIFKELKDDLKVERTDSTLYDWANQGVLLLNSILSVKRDCPASHRDLMWQRFTDKVISVLNSKETPLVFILWGNYAISKETLITNPKHLIIKSVHPSPLSAHRGFFGSKPFSKTNDFLIKNKQEPIKW